jgi:hypothetical protein
MDYLDAFVALMVRCLFGQAVPARADAGFPSEAGCDVRSVQAPQMHEGLFLGRGAVVGRGVVPTGRRKTPAREAPRAASTGVAANRSNFGLRD